MDFTPPKKGPLSYFFTLIGKTQHFLDRTEQKSYIIGKVCPLRGFFSHKKCYNNCVNALTVQYTLYLAKPHNQSQHNIVQPTIHRIQRCRLRYTHRHTPLLHHSWARGWDEWILFFQISGKNLFKLVSVWEAVPWFTGIFPLWVCTQAEMATICIWVTRWKT